MSVQFGIWNQDGRPVDSGRVEKAKALLAPYGPDGCGSHQRGNVSILYHAFHTTRESRREKQPHSTASGAVITWDGRLDNRDELLSECGHCLSSDATDVAIVAAAYEKWATRFFAKLIGDWTISIWNPSERSLILAKDPIGTKHLYYALGKDQVSWSTVLDPLVLLAGKTFTLEEEYIAGWLSFFPASHLTPYAGIHSVPPSSFVLLRAGTHKVAKYWDFDPSRTIRYGTDAEYEEHFRAVFHESVRRRLRSDRPVFGELSGGMDSSSIVCMADVIIARGAAETPRLDTISYYNDSEPNWNERPYFTRVEKQRGSEGFHINLQKSHAQTSEIESTGLPFTPGSWSCADESRVRFSELLTRQNTRVVLSGIGGDEVAGGLPTPLPELEDLLARGQFRALAHRLKAWALNQRRPWFHILCEAGLGFLAARTAKHVDSLSWLRREFVRRNRRALLGYPSRLKFFGPLPSFQENVSTLEQLRRQLTCTALVGGMLHEKRYPYLDRHLLEFLYAIPREQLVRPGHRRSLVRRALIGIVPSEILDRRRKAYVARAPIIELSHAWDGLHCGEKFVSAALGIVHDQELSKAVQKARLGRRIALAPLARAFKLELWLRRLMLEQGLHGCKKKLSPGSFEEETMAPAH